MTSPSYPSIRLKPKTNARAIRWGAPWVFDNELVTDRRTKSLEPGSLAVLEDENRTPLALVAVNPNSRIMGRVLDRNTEAVIDLAWFREKIARALALRARLYPHPFYRLVHAEADGLPGVVIDRFGDIAVIQPNAAWADRLIDLLAEAVRLETGVSTVMKNASGRARGLEGLDDVSAILSGNAPTDPVQVPMNGATYLADLVGGQKTGLFFDQRPNHAFAASLSKGQRVLDVFSHVGGFALACLAGGAASALSVDGSEAALALARGGAEASGTADRFDTRKGDAFDVLLEGVKMRQLITDGFLCEPKIYAASVANLTGVRSVGGDYNRADLETALMKSRITGDAVREYQQHADGLPAIVFC
ncbi:MAG: RlmI/RlmK family 23S rRNA methyltransferase, partial [Rhodobacteraceae bacterium]|nr:RlmI/RlmK family 23S rRNA methyltransferase [Paracoccaceae bacterium]